MFKSAGRGHIAIAHQADGAAVTQVSQRPVCPDFWTSDKISQMTELSPKQPLQIDANHTVA